MRILFSALFLLFYLACAGFVVALVVSNTHEISLQTLVAGEISLPLYLPVAISFFSGIVLTLISVCVHRVGTRLSRHL